MSQNDPVRVPTQDEYEDATIDTTWAALNHVDGSFQVRELAPLRLIRSMEKYGVMGMLGDGVDVEDIVKNGDFSGFIDNVVLPNVLKPYVFWSDPRDLLKHLDDDTVADLEMSHDIDGMDDDRVRAIIEAELDGPAFDLAALEPDDLNAIITGMTGKDADDLKEQAENKFRG